MTSSTPDNPASSQPVPPVFANRRRPREQSQGLICPNCAGVVPVAEGIRIVQCPYCSMNSLVQGERGVRRWQVERKIDRSLAEAVVRDFLSDIRKARDLARTARIDELILVYLPFWRVEATVAGWLFGRVREDKDSTKPDEHFVFESMHWNDSAFDVSEFGVHRIVVSRGDLQPFDSQAVHAEAMVFDPSESRTEALSEARDHFLYRAHSSAGQRTTYYENVQLLRPDFGLVYYPVWLARYSYRNRVYQVVIDGALGKVMYGKAPGNIFYRAVALVGGLAAGNLILVNGTILAGLVTSDSDDGLAALLLPIVAGIGLILFGYRQFRYGEEVEDKPRDYRKAALGPGKGLLGSVFPSLGELPDVMKTGMTVLEDFKELSEKNRMSR